MGMVDPSAMRRLNVATALQTVYEQGPLVINDLHQLTGVSRRTLEPIVSDLIAQGWINESVPAAAHRRTAGRPARVMAFNASAGYVLAVHMDFGYMIVEMADLNGNPAAKIRSTLSNSLSREERIQHLFDEVNRLLLTVRVSREQILALTVVTPGIVRDNGRVDLPTTFLDWSGFPLRERISEAFQCPVQVENDAKLAALGEAVLSGGSSDGNFIWLRADGVRTGLGIVIHGELYRGADGAAGELVWARALNFEPVRNHLFAGLVDPEHPRWEEAQTMLRLARAGDATALSSVESLAAAMCPGLEALAWILAPQEIIIGGAFAELGDMLAGAIGRHLFDGSHPVEARLRMSGSTERAIITGAVHMALVAVKAKLFSGDGLAASPALSRGSLLDASRELDVVR